MPAAFAEAMRRLRARSDDWSTLRAIKGVAEAMRRREERIGRPPNVSSIKLVSIDKAINKRSE